MRENKNTVIIIGQTPEKDMLAEKIENAGYPIAYYSLVDFADISREIPGLENARAVVFDTTHTDPDGTLIERALRRAAERACVPCIMALTPKMSKILNFQGKRLDADKQS